MKCFEKNESIGKFPIENDLCGYREKNQDFHLWIFFYQWKCVLLHHILFIIQRRVSIRNQFISKQTQQIQLKRRMKFKHNRL